MVFAEKAHKKFKDPDSNIERVLDLGFVGEPVEVDRKLLDLLAHSEMIPVIAPVAPGRDGHTYNINADTFAGAIAGAAAGMTTRGTCWRTSRTWARNARTVMRAMNGIFPSPISLQPGSTG